MIRSFVKRFAILSDELVGTNIYQKFRSLRAKWRNSPFLNLIRCSVTPQIVTWKYKIGIKDKIPLKLHIGCGNRHFEGYINVDFRKTTATDLVCDIRRLPYPNDAVEIIETYHVIEHLPRHDLPRALKEWNRVLVVGGRLIIECPDFDGAVKQYMQGNEKRIDNIFGLQRFAGDIHQFGYNFKRLKTVLGEVGFIDIRDEEPQDYHSNDEPCLRVDCVKGDNSRRLLS